MPSGSINHSFADLDMKYGELNCVARGEVEVLYEMYDGNIDFNIDTIFELDILDEDGELLAEDKKPPIEYVIRHIHAKHDGDIISHIEDDAFNQ